MKTLGQRLRQERERREWTQAELAEMCDVRVTSVWKWETDRAIPKFTHAALLAQLFDIDIASLAKHLRHEAKRKVKRALRAALATGARKNPFGD